MRPRRTVLAALAAAIAVALGTGGGALAGDDEGEDVAPPHAWRAGPKTVFLRRIVDAATGRPIAGAVVKLFPEVPHPLPDLGTPAATATSGPDGWVRIEEGAYDEKIVARYGPPTWFFVDAKGYAPAGDMASLVPGTPPVSGTDWEIEPGETVRVSLVDPLDRPVAGALVGWLFGCGHTPDQRSARTGTDGVAVFPDASTSSDGRFWPVINGLRAPTGYVEEPYAEGEPVRVARLVWSQTVEGTILAPGGAPAAGVAVGLPSWHRGPWTRTDREGRFRLVGSQAETGKRLLIEQGEYPVGPRTPDPALVGASTFRTPPAGRRVTVRLPAVERPDEEPPVEPNLVVTVRREGWPTSTAHSVTTVVAVRESDGWTDAEYAPDGTARLAVLPGRYAVEAVATREGEGIVHARARVDVEVAAAAPAGATIDLPAPAVQPFEVDWPAPSLEAIELVTEGASTLVPREDTRAFDVFLPAGGDVVVRVAQGARVRRIAIDRRTLVAGARAAVIHIPSFPEVRAKARLVDEAGHPVAGWLSAAAETRSEDETPPTAFPASETPVVTVDPDEPLRLLAWARDADAFSPRFVELPAGPSSSDVVDLGEVRLARRAPTLSLRRPLAGHTQLVVRITRGARSAELKLGLEAGADGDVATIVDPWWHPGLVAEGALVRVTPDSTEYRANAAVVHRLEGPGPWTIDPPGGSIEISVSDPEGAALADWTARVDGVGYDGGGPRLSVVALEPGEHEAIVDAPGHVPRRLRFTLAAGERRAWRVVLRPEPAPPK